MFRTAVLCVVAACVLPPVQGLAFAPVPIVRPLDDPQKAVEAYLNDLLAGMSERTFVARKRKLSDRLKVTIELYEARGATDRATEVTALLNIVKELDRNFKVEKDVRLSDLLRDISVAGKYRKLLAVIPSEGCHRSYGFFKECGHWTGTSWAGRENLRPGHWVYRYPYWYVWAEVAPSQ